MNHGPKDREAVDEAVNEALRRAYPAVPFPRERIEDRIDATFGGAARPLASAPRVPGAVGSWVRPLLTTAASVLLFIGGAEYGRRTISPVPNGAGPGGPPSVAATPQSVSLSIQASGSEYVASLARFAGEAQGLSPDQRAVAREVALTLLYGAALELLRASEEDEQLEEVVRSLSVKSMEASASARLLGGGA